MRRNVGLNGADTGLFAKDSYSRGTTSEEMNASLNLPKGEALV